MKNNNIKKMLPSVLLLILAVAAACYYYRDRIPVSLRAIIAKESEILTINKLPLGSSYENVKEVYSEVSPLQGQDGYLDASKAVFTEAICKINALDYPAVIKFKFHENKLYSYYFTFKDLDKVMSTKLMKEIEKVFTPVYGKPKNQIMELNNEHTATICWQDAEHTVTATASTSDSKNYTISAGYQLNSMR